MSNNTATNLGKDVWGANDIQAIVERNAAYMTAFIVAGVKAVMRDGRPLFTERTTEADRLAALLQAPPQFWDALAASDPETAASLAADIIRAREKGKIPAEGPRANEVQPETAPAGAPPTTEAGIEAENIGKPGTGTERNRPLPSFTRMPNALSSG